MLTNRLDICNFGVFRGCNCFKAYSNNPCTEDGSSLCSIS